MKKHLISAVLALSLLICLPLGASAHPVPDESQNGYCSITVTMRYKGKPVSGGTVNLYKVGYVYENDGNYSFKPVTAVQSVVTEFEDIQSPDLAQKLAKQVDKLTPVTTKPITIDKNGAAAFTDLDFGLYLVVQKTAASGYIKTAPFLVSVPYLDDGAYVYAVASDPKTELEREVKPTTPTTPHSSSDSGGKDYIGVLTIPSLELELPVISQWDYAALKVAPCRYSGSLYQNNLIICAHNFASHFGKLKNLRAGDIAIFTDMEENAVTFQMVERETLEPTDLEGMEAGDWDMTLYTCTVGGQSRVTVRFVREES